MNSRSFTGWGLSLVLLLVAGFGLAACGTSSTLYVTKDFAQPLDADSATVVATGSGVSRSKAAAKLKEMLVKRLKERGLFDRIGPDGDVRIRATIQNLDDGKTVGRSLSLKGKAEVTVEVKITQPNGSVLAHITASAESPRDDEKDRPDLRALRAAADKIVEYLEEHRGSRSDKDEKAKEKKAKDEKAEDEKAEDEKAEDEKAKDEKAEDEKAEDEKAEDEKAKDEKAGKQGAKKTGKDEK